MSELPECELIEFNYFKKWLAIGKGSQIHMFMINDNHETTFDSSVECNSRVLKIVWSDNQCVDLIAVLTEDMSVSLFLRNYSKNSNNLTSDDYLWEKIHKFPPVGSKSTISDIKFAPSKYGMLLAILHENGQLFVYQTLSTLFLRKDAPWISVYETTIDRFCVCAGWSSVKLDDNNNLILLAIVAYGNRSDSNSLFIPEGLAPEKEENLLNNLLDREIIFYQMNPIQKLWSHCFTWPLPKDENIINNIVFIEKNHVCDCVLLTSNGFQILNISKDDRDKFKVVELDSVDTLTNGIESAFWNYINETLECSCGDEKVHHFTKNAYDYWQEVINYNKLTLSTVMEFLVTKMNH